MTDEEKYLLAKKHYEECVNRISSQTITPNKGLVSSFLTTTQDNTYEDFYWTDHVLTPTALYRWIKKQHNNTTKQRKDWLTQVSLPKKSYDALIIMYEEFIPPLIVSGVTIGYHDSL